MAIKPRIIVDTCPKCYKVGDSFIYTDGKKYKVIAVYSLSIWKLILKFMGFNTKTSGILIELI